MKVMMLCRIMLYACLLLAPCTMTAAEPEDSTGADNRLTHQAEVDIAPGYVLQTNDFYRGLNKKEEKIDRTFALHLKYGFQFAHSSRLGQLYPHTYQGIGISCNTFFDSEEIGTPVAVYVFQGSRIARLTRHLSLDYEWNFGASFGWKHYDENNNSMNITIGSSVNAYINLGLFLKWQMSRQWKLTAGMTATHYSNGNTHYPNAGLNAIGMRIGVVRTFGNGDDDRPYLPATAARPVAKPHISYDVMVYGAKRSKAIVSENYLVPGSFGIVGFNINPLYQFNRHLKAGASIDGQYDESANIENHIAGRDENNELKFYRPPFCERMSVGLSLRGEFVMPVFSINFGIGHNILFHGDDTKGLYEILALKTSITRNLFLHIGYELMKFRDPKNLMIGIGFRFHN